MKKVPQEDLEHILQNTQGIWDNFRGMSIFLTGGTGFFGKWILESFFYINQKLSLNATMTVLSRNPEDFLDSNPFYRNFSNHIIFIKGDVLNFDYELDQKFDFIIHGATSTSSKLNSQEPLLMLNTIIKGTTKILNFARSQSLKGFLFISSGAVYGNQPENVKHIKETDMFKIDNNNTSSAYSIGKKVAELYCSLYAKQHKIPIKIARCFAFVGPHLPLDSHFAIGNFIMNYLNNEDIIVKGNGKTLRSYMYASDLMIWLWKILSTGKTNGIYNVGSDESISIEKLAFKVLGTNANKVIISNSEFYNERYQYVPSINKAKSELGLSIKIDIDSAIKKTKLFHMKN